VYCKVLSTQNPLRDQLYIHHGYHYIAELTIEKLKTIIIYINLTEINNIIYKYLLL
jgi:hypothetical protein